MNKDEFVCPYNALLIKIKVEFIHIFTRLKYTKLYTMYHLEPLFSVQRIGSLCHGFTL